MISSSYRCQICVDKLIIGEGEPTTVKVFVGHDMLSAVFNSLEVAQRVDKLNGAVRVCPIQSSKVVVTGYLGDSTKTLDVQHWTKYYNVYPRLLKVDVEFKMMNIKDPNREPIKWNPKNQVIAAHILCAEKDLEKVVIAVGNINNKVKKLSKAVGEVPEAQAMKWVPYGSTNVIKQTSKCHFWLQKNRIMHKWRLEQHHTIPFWGLDNIYKVLTSPNGAEFAICQVIMSIKTVENLITPLYFGVNVSPEGEVVIICDIGMKDEAEALLAHFGIYAAVIFGSVVLEAFTVACKLSMASFQWSPAKNCSIEIDNSTIASDRIFDKEFAKCGFTDNVIEIPKEVMFNLIHQITLHVCPDIADLLGDENGDSGTITSMCSDATIATSKKALPTPINYLAPHPIPPSPKLSAVKSEETPVVTMNDPPDKADAPKTLPTPTTTSPEVKASNDRSEGSSED